MCGIQLIALRADHASRAEIQELRRSITEANQRRGPDWHGLLNVDIHDGQRLEFSAHVLHLRGSRIQEQPLRDASAGDVFCWNGEVFEGLDIGPEENDGRVLLEILRRSRRSELEVLSVLQRVQGPYAFIYWQATFVLSSVGYYCPALPDTSAAEAIERRANFWREVPARTVFCLNLGDGLTVQDIIPETFKTFEWWPHSESNNSSELARPTL
ncbi:hypothetical protein EV182_003530, partial [Spiromyces aspiralis]